MARRPSVKPTASGTEFVLLMGATGIVIPVKVVVGVLESSVGVSVSWRTLFDQRMRARISHRTICTLLSHFINDLPEEIQINLISSIVVVREGYSVSARTEGCI